MRALWMAASLLFVACGSDEEPPLAATPTSTADVTTTSAGTAGAGAGGTGAGGEGAGGEGAGGAGAMGPDVDRSDPQLHEFELDPQVLDPTTVDSLEPQYAQLDTRAEPLGHLVIFLTGSTNVPAGWRDHGRKLAELGFHVVLPHYDNRWSSEGACSGGPPGCSTDTRWEALVGEDTSSVVDISRADSAEGRVVTMLSHLVDAHPGGDWGYYLQGADGVRYERIVIAGISHGASSTGLYATRRAFARAVLHSGGAAGDPQVAKETPLADWYAFAHTGDPAYEAITGSWESHGLLGPVTAIDEASPPYGDAHQLYSSLLSTYPHCSTAVHSSSPDDGLGGYAFEPAWRHLYGTP